MNTELVLEIQAPGYKKNEIQIEFDNRWLIATGISEKYGNAGFSEYIPEEYEIENATAKLEDGILEIKFPLKQKANRILEIQ